MPILSRLTYAHLTRNDLITLLKHKIKEVREIEHAIYWDRDQENKFKEKWEILHQI